MYRYLYFSIFSLIVSLLCPNTSGAEKNVPEKHNSEESYCKTIGITEGLSQSSVTSVTYDKYGSLWIGTRYGLNEYRNRQMRQFHHSGPENLTGDYIHMLHIDTRDTLWVSTDAGICKYDHTEDKFRNISAAQAFAAYQDTTGIYFGTDNGILHYKDGHKTIHQLKNSYINAIYPFQDQLLIVDKGLGLWTFDGYVFTKLTYPELDAAVIMSSAMKDGMLYLSLYRKGLCVIDLEKSETTFYSTSNSDLSFDIILSMLMIGEDLWMGTDGGGINIFSTTDCSIRRLELPSSSITTLYQDPYSNIWAGSVRSGLHGLKASRIISFDTSNGALTNNVILSLAEGTRNRIWIGTDGGGINVYDGNTSSISHIGSTADMKIPSIAELPGEKLLVSSYSHGLKILDIRRKTWSPFTLVDQATNTREILYGNTPNIYSIDSHRFIITAIDVYEYNHSDGSFIRFTSKDRSTTADLKIFHNEKDICYAHSPEGIFKLDCKEHMITKIPTETEGKKISAAAYADSFIWIGTSDGLYTYSISAKTTEHVPMNLFKRITSLHADNYGSLWIAADNTLFRKTYDRTEIIGENEGVATNEILTGLSVEQNNENMIFLGGTNGLVKIGSDDQMSDDGITKELRLHNVSIGGRRTTIINNRLNLPYNSSAIRISVMLSPTDPFSRHVYRFQIEGKSTYSIETYDDFILLPDLKDGKYEMKASYLKNDGFWSDAINVLDINVRPIWYRSYWWNISWVSLFLAIVICTVRQLYKNKMRKMEMRIRAENDNFVKKLNKYITANLDNPQLDIPSIALHMAMSRASLYSRVKKILGKGVAQHIDELRMKEACRLLEQEDISIGDISDRIGYSSQRYFSTRFKQFTGLTPRGYRAKHKEKHNF